MDYASWNNVLADYFLTGVPLNSSIYLSVDPGTLERINSVRGLGLKDPVTDFMQAIRDAVLIGGAVRLSRYRGFTPEGYPRGVAFLAAMVLAAHDMESDEQASSSNYFTRLCELLGAQKSTKNNRPEGIDTAGDEEALWLEWNQYLRKVGFDSTARPGYAVADKYTHYPLSQALLRKTDQEGLTKVFKDIPKSLDIDGLNTQITKSSILVQLPKFLQTRLKQRQSNFPSLMQAIFDHYEDFQATGGQTKTHRRSLFLGIYRQVSWPSNDVRYLFYPKQRQGMGSDQLRFTFQGRSYTLDQERPGWYEPFGNISPGDLGSDQTIPLVDHPHLSNLIYRKRDFVILVGDSGYLESGALATWHRPTLGESFILLAQAKYKTAIESFRSEGVLDYRGRREMPDGWLEYLGCTVISDNWIGLGTSTPQLTEALKPSVQLSLQLEGGLKVPGGWLADHGPSIQVSSLAGMVTLTITDIESGQEITHKLKNDQESIKPNWLTGKYRLVAQAGEERWEKEIDLLGWDKLLVSPELGQQTRHIGEYKLRGPEVSNVE